MGRYKLRLWYRTAIGAALDHTSLSREIIMGRYQLRLRYCEAVIVARGPPPAGPLVPLDDLDLKFIRRDINRFDNRPAEKKKEEGAPKKKPETGG